MGVIIRYLYSEGVQFSGGQVNPGCVRSNTWIWLFSSTDNTIALSGGEIQTDNILYLFDKMRVITQAKCFDTMGLVYFRCTAMREML
jgi:hypothetical protein